MYSSQRGSSASLPVAERDLEGALLGPTHSEKQRRGGPAPTRNPSWLHFSTGNRHLLPCGPFLSPWFLSQTPPESLARATPRLWTHPCDLGHASPGRPGKVFFSMWFRGTEPFRNKHLYQNPLAQSVQGHALPSHVSSLTPVAAVPRAGLAGITLSQAGARRWVHTWQR